MVFCHIVALAAATASVQKDWHGNSDAYFTVLKVRSQHMMEEFQCVISVI